MGMSICSRLHNSLVILMEHTQIHTLLVPNQLLNILPFFWVAGVVRLGGSRGGVRVAVDGRRPRRGGAGHPGDVDHRPGASHVPGEVPEVVAGRCKEIDG
ncbi:hypothetical protein HYC85_014308 [Camellia sinensis]|uniref:Uncharacterized protein n=1 Tax=Camellia sinensis TaxID=4442 RepID=A0A7J7H7Y1_CAMSI|nr:hypothetical protein HYC85_014308 [Camellia sinensis]